MSEFLTYLLWLGDDALIHAQRLAGWTSRAPELEEDVALTNIALDQLGIARELLTYAGETEGAGRDEDDLAYLREERDFRNCQLVELADVDFGYAIAKLLFVAAYQQQLYAALATSADERLAAIAGKAATETEYHLDHARLWTLRLGDGTAESHRRAQAAVDALWPYTHELFGGAEALKALVTDKIAVDPATLRPAWLSTVEGVLAEATLDRPADGWQPTGGRDGVHTEAMGYLLAELQYLRRAHPGARW